MSRYTFILEFDGGTYLSQVDAGNETDALVAWCDRLQRDKPFAARSKRLAEAVKRGLSTGGLTLVSGITGTWCFSTVFAKELVLGHVVLTADE